LKFISTALVGAFVIELEPLIDERGFFARTFCQQEFEALGLDPGLRQCSISFNHRRGTLRRRRPTKKPNSCAAPAARSMT